MTLTIFNPNNNHGCENSESIDISISWPFNLNDENEVIDFVVFPNPFSSYTNINVSNQGY